MLPRQASELLTHLEEVADVGCTIIRRQRLIHWYGQQRLTVGVWRDIHAKWLEVVEAIQGLEDKNIQLFAGEGDGTIALVWGEGLTSDGSWLKPISEFSRS
ncbi:hypothetical protein ABIF07_003578 [Bradyrhizobium elkanii]|uniref:hypothetical protein n=1 Tax=Bradyrhizobium elkanii TaxID=29448 RepID=UPI002169B429|nr:hypothetical protein [Bradyrhizobium elkanii]MCS3689396.1 hypothetical protein [Bradyrhizobium elkanii]